MTFAPWDVIRAELGDELQRSTVRRPCLTCGRATRSTIRRCYQCGSNIEAADQLYARLRAQCCDISGLDEAELDRHAASVAETVAHAKKRSRS